MVLEIQILVSKFQKIGSQACSPPLLLLLLRDATGFRGRRLEVEGWGDGVIIPESMLIRRQHVFSDFSTLRPSFKKVRFQALRFQDPCGRVAKTMQYMCVSTKDGASPSGRPLRFHRHNEEINQDLTFVNVSCSPTNPNT